MLPSGGASEIFPSDEQIRWLNLWPPPANHGRHTHGKNRGEDCSDSEILLYGADRALCCRCGRVWIKSMAPMRRAELLQAQLALAESNLADLGEQRVALRRQLSRARQRRKAIRSELDQCRPKEPA